MLHEKEEYSKNDSQQAFAWKMGNQSIALQGMDRRSLEELLATICWK